MSKEILMVVEMVSNEKGIPQDEVFDAISEALVQATKKRYGMDWDFRVFIDPKTGEYDTFRIWEVVADDFEEAQEDDDDFVEFNSLCHIKLSDAKKKNADLNLGDYIEEQVASVEFGRIAAQAAKQVIMQKVKEAERREIGKKMQHFVGTIISGQVRRIMKDQLIVELMGHSCDAIMPKSEMVPRENYRVGDRVKAYLKEIKEVDGQSSIILSRSCDEIIEAFFKLEVPEISEEVIEINAIAREPGQRCKVAVSSNDKRIDPRGSCIGVRGSRVQAISNEFNGEKIDVLIWSEDPVELVIDAMQPAEVLSIVMDEDTHSIDVIVDESQLSQAIGRNGQNVRLASRLAGWELNVIGQQEAKDKEEGEQLATVGLFMNALSVEESVAQELANAGFTTLEEVAYVADEELLAIEGVDEVSVTKLQEAANAALLNQALSGESFSGPQADLLTMDGMTLELANQLSAIGVYSMEDLAEQAVDDLADIKDLTPEKAGELIMQARAPWFENDDD
jgi:transcription termination/antitermination protein NusA